jgi:hypothetical protein
VRLIGVHMCISIYECICVCMQMLLEGSILKNLMLGVDPQQNVSANDAWEIAERYSERV